MTHGFHSWVMSMQVLLAVDSWTVFSSGQPCSVRDVVPTCLRTELATTFDRRTAMGSWVCVECTGRSHGVGIGPSSKLGPISIKVVRSEVLDHAIQSFFDRSCIPPPATWDGDRSRAAYDGSNHVDTIVDRGLWRLFAKLTTGAGVFATALSSSGVS